MTCSILHIVDPRFVSQTEFHEVASIVCQALPVVARLLPAHAAVVAAVVISRDARAHEGPTRRVHERLGVKAPVEFELKYRSSSAYVCFKR